MLSFLDLPIDILPLVLSFLLKPAHLALACSVSKSFHESAIPILYRRIAIYAWHKHAKSKAVRLFETLSMYPHLARHVHRLEMRDFPKALLTGGIDLPEMVVNGLKNCVNLQACTWTRDGSLNSDILEALQRSLHELEINGNSEGNYEPRILQRFSDLRKVSLIMPSGSVVAALNPWVVSLGSNLRSLTLICKASPIINDTVLGSLAPHLESLDHFYITGCPKVTHQGIWAVLSLNKTGIIGLGLEGLSQRFDMSEFARLCSQKHSLDRLKSITLTIHQQKHPLEIWMQEVCSLLSTAPLEVFQIYSTGPFVESLATDDFWRNMAAIHCARLTRFSVHRMLISLDAIDNLCQTCTALEQLFVVVEQHSLDQLSTCLSSAKRLRVVHINYPLEAQTESSPVLSPSEALKVVNRCSSTLTQLGCNTRVWQVGRSIHINEKGEMHVQRQLSPYESLDIPEPFLVVRT